MADSPKPAANTSERVLETAARILAPLVRLLIAKGVTFQMASEVLKQVYVRVAQKQFVDDDEATGTKLSLLTGLNRKEIRRLTSEDVEKNGAPMSSYASGVHAVWRTQRQWLDEAGKPMLLPRRSIENSLSFDDLVKSVTTDHRPSAVFEELMRLNYIELDENNYIRLKQGAFSATPGESDKLTRMAENLEDHMSASVTNVMELHPKFLEQFVYSDELSVESAEKLHQFSRAEWDSLNDALIKRAISLEGQDALENQIMKTRIRVGMYFYSAPSPTPDKSAKE
jgi:Family of unknown function (DUF6502)